ncbi:glycine-rich RNA-binding protein 4, mitochondrial-like [Dorcoceras hygrometricum]|uniref:Glycine-rich RNA-binding protein 4, mitochondrial-like n=1 Tax=Dorcoceras hygrometricum TaxID=472368 RepID=A0A2Z7BXL6_9LAMI|nr:glycine-rich RNA-binding protein 4, mitochondrial-like [Dorcoceras hygrometricum]
MVGLSYDTNETILKEAFEKYGEVIEVKVICNRVSGKSKGYGFVNYTLENAATQALNEMNGQLLDGKIIRVHRADGGNREQKSVSKIQFSVQTILIHDHVGVFAGIDSRGSVLFLQGEKEMIILRQEHLKRKRVVCNMIKDDGALIALGSPKVLSTESTSSLVIKTITKNTYIDHVEHKLLAAEKLL